MRGKSCWTGVRREARILPPEEWPRARKTIERKYWLAELRFLWSKKNVYIEIRRYDLNASRLPRSQPRYLFREMLRKRANDAWSKSGFELGHCLNGL